MRFRISPDAFFQVNTPAAEVVYSLVKELCTTEKPPVIYGQFSTIVIGHCHGNRLFVLPSLLRLMEGLELSQLMRTEMMPTKYVISLLLTDLLLHSICNKHTHYPGNI